LTSRFVNLIEINIRAHLIGQSVLSYFPLVEKPSWLPPLDRTLSMGMISFANGLQETCKTFVFRKIKASRSRLVSRLGTSKAAIARDLSIGVNLLDGHEEAPR
jgi:hypothetical protein